MQNYDNFAELFFPLCSVFILDIIESNLSKENSHKGRKSVQRERVIYIDLLHLGMKFAL